MMRYRQRSRLAYTVLVLCSAVVPGWAGSNVKQHTDPVTGHKPVVQPTLSSTSPSPGDTLSVVPNFTDPDGDIVTSYNYQWQVETIPGSNVWTDIGGQSGSTYMVADTDQRKKLRVKVTPLTNAALTEPDRGDETLSDIADVSAIIREMPGDIEANGYTFAINSGFPKTGFSNAMFQLRIDGDTVNNADYSWSSDQQWVSVNDGEILFSGKATSNTRTVTITAIPKLGGSTYSYTFTINKWFTGDGNTQTNWQGASSYCSGRGGLPGVLEMTGALAGSTIRQVGALWSEWGDTGYYSQQNLPSGNYWASDQYISNYHYSVMLNNGVASRKVDSTNLNIICRETF